MWYLSLYLQTNKICFNKLQLRTYENKLKTKQLINMSQELVLVDTSSNQIRESKHEQLNFPLTLKIIPNQRITKYQNNKFFYFSKII